MCLWISGIIQLAFSTKFAFKLFLKVNIPTLFLTFHNSSLWGIFDHLKLYIFKVYSRTLYTHALWDDHYNLWIISALGWLVLLVHVTFVTITLLFKKENSCNVLREFFTSLICYLLLFLLKLLANGYYPHNLHHRMNEFLLSCWYIFGIFQIKIS